MSGGAELISQAIESGIKTFGHGFDPDKEVLRVEKDHDYLNRSKTAIDTLASRIVEHLGEERTLHLILDHTSPMMRPFAKIECMLLEALRESLGTNLVIQTLETAHDHNYDRVVEALINRESQTPRFILCLSDLNVEFSAYLLERINSTVAQSSVEGDSFSILLPRTDFQMPNTFLTNRQGFSEYDYNTVATVPTFNLNSERFEKDAANFKVIIDPRESLDLVLELSSDKAPANNFDEQCQLWIRNASANVRQFTRALSLIPITLDTMETLAVFMQDKGFLGTETGGEFDPFEVEILCAEAMNSGLLYRVQESGSVKIEYAFPPDVEWWLKNSVMSMYGWAGGFCEERGILTFENYRKALGW